jgi:hypothetical protein
MEQKVALFRPVYWTAKLLAGVVAALRLFLLGTMVEFVVGITAALGVPVARLLPDDEGTEAAERMVAAVA